MLFSSYQSPVAKKYAKIGSVLVFSYLALVVFGILTGSQISGPNFGGVLLALYASPLLFVGFIFFVLSSVREEKTKIESNQKRKPWRTIGVGALFLALGYFNIPALLFQASSNQTPILELVSYWLPILGWLAVASGLVSVILQLFSRK